MIDALDDELAFRIRRLTGTPQYLESATIITFPMVVVILSGTEGRFLGLLAYVVLGSVAGFLFVLTLAIIKGVMRGIAYP